MTGSLQQPGDSGGRSFAWGLVQGALFWKYVILFVAVTSFALLSNSLIDIWFTFREHRAALIRLQREQAESAAAKITQFIREIEGQLGWTTYLGATPTPAQLELDGLRLLRQVPAITELSVLNHQGREQLRLSRQAMNQIGSGADFSGDERFKAAAANRVYYGPVYFRRGTEPFMTLAISDPRPNAGVSIAAVNLTHIWDVVRQIRVGRNGRAYVVDAQGLLIAHPDISLVLRNTDLSQLPQVQLARSERKPTNAEDARAARDVHNERVLTAYATAAPLNWLVFVELPETEANEPFYTAMTRFAAVVLAGLVLALLAALFLAHRMVTPIRALTAGAARIGAGALDHRIDISTGDELEALGGQFNEMATQLQVSYTTLERKVDERTHQLQAANMAKSRFLAAASHDLRQPLHALNLFVAQLRAETNRAERDRLAERIDAAIANMNDLFNALLDVSKLDAGALSATISEFAVGSVLMRIEATFATAAREKGLRFCVVPSSAWIRSDPILLERILLNLASNAVRYTSRGGIVVGCRRDGGRMRIDVCDTGIGIPEDQQRNIFDEFYRVVTTGWDGTNGLGLGLAIVERLCALLEHPISLESMAGKGSRFSVSIPLVRAPSGTVERSAAGTAMLDPVRGKLIAVIDDDALVLVGTAGLLKKWGCRVVTAASDGAMLACLDRDKPDLIMSDFFLQDGRTGIGAITRIRSTFQTNIPAFLISGDISPERVQEARASGYHLLHKPVSPMTLRTLISRLLREASAVRELT